MSRVTIERPEDGVAVVAMHDEPGRNAFSEAFCAELLGALQEVAAAPDVRAVVLTGLPDVFCSGASREVLRRVVESEVVPSDLPLAKVLLDLPVPVVAAMEGHAVGGGLALGLTADIVILAEESRYGASFMNMGFTPGMGLTRLLEHTLSPAVAHELLYTGEARRGAAFVGRSGWNHIVPRAEVRPLALDLAARIADKPRVALEALKRTLAAPKRRAFEGSRAVEALMHGICFQQPDIQARIEVGYVE